MDTYTPLNSINSVNYEKLKRLTENNLRYKLEIIELKKQLNKNNN